MKNIWRVSREWNGETCFIVAGGPSVAAQDTEALRGRRVIAINSSWRKVPFADVLFFGDSRWFNHNYRDVVRDFAGRIVTAAGEVEHVRLLHMHKAPPPGLADAPDTVMIRRTSSTAAINLAVHLGVARIVLLGLDGKPGPEGRTHHHAPHPWDLRHDCWRDQSADLASLVGPLQSRGVTVINTSLQSDIEFWPKVPLEQVLHGAAADCDQGNARAWRQPTPTGDHPALHVRA